MNVTSTTPDRLVIEDRPWFLWLVFYGMGGGALLAGLSGQIEDTLETLFVIALGLGTLWAGWYFAPFQRFTFDRPLNTFTHELRRLTGARTWQRPLTDIRRAADEGNWSDSARLERVTLLTAQGRYPLESGFTSTPRRDVIRSINDWLGI